MCFYILICYSSKHSVIVWKSSYFLHNSTKTVKILCSLGSFSLFLTGAKFSVGILKACIGGKSPPLYRKKTASVFNSQHLANKSTLTDPLIPGSRLGSLCVARTPLERTAFPSLQMIKHQDNRTERSRILFASITVEGGNCMKISTTCTLEKNTVTK